MDTKLFTAYKERVIKLSTRDTAVKCTKTSLKRKVFDASRFNKSTIEKLADIIINYSDESLIIDCDSFYTDDIDKRIDNIKSELETLSESDTQNDTIDELNTQLDKLSKDRLTRINSGLKQLVNIEREGITIQKQNGTYTVYIGYKFITGRADSRTLINAPLFLIPLTIVSKQSKASVSVALNKNRPILINNKVLILLEAMCGIKGTNNYEVDQLMLSDNIKGLLFNNNSLISDKTSDEIESIKEKDTIMHNMLIYNAIGIGIFNISTSIYNDYTKLEDKKPNALIARLFDGGMSASEVIQYKNIINNLAYKPQELHLISKLDSSQECAVYMASKNKGIVVFGPPGTGKSQVITNIVANSLATKKRILLVSEKKTALDVVHNRLGILNKYAMILKDSGDIEGFKYKISNTANTYLDSLVDSSSERDILLNNIEYNLDYLQNIYESLNCEVGNSGKSLSDLYKLCNTKNYDLDYKILTEYTSIHTINYDELVKIIDNIDSNIIKFYDKSIKDIDTNIISRTPLQLRMLLEDIRKYKSLSDDFNSNNWYHMKNCTNYTSNLNKLEDICRTYTSNIGEINYKQDECTSILSIDIERLYDKFRYLDETFKIKNIGCKYKSIDELDSNIEQEYNNKFKNDYTKIDEYNHMLTLLSSINYSNVFTNNKISNISLDNLLNTVEYLVNLSTALTKYIDKYNLKYDDTFDRYIDFINYQLTSKYSEKLDMISGMISSGYADSTTICVDLSDEKCDELLLNIEELRYKPNKLFKKYDKINNENLVKLKSMHNHLTKKLDSEIHINTQELNNIFKHTDLINFIEINSFSDVLEASYMIANYIKGLLDELNLYITNTKNDIYNAYLTQINILNNNDMVIKKTLSDISSILICDEKDIGNIIGSLLTETRELITKANEEIATHQILSTNIEEMKEKRVDKFIDSYDIIDKLINNYDIMTKVYYLSDTESQLVELLQEHSKEDILNSYVSVCIDMATNNRSIDINKYEQLVSSINAFEDEALKLTINNIDFTTNNDIIDKLSKSGESILELVKALTTKRRNGLSIKELVDKYNELLNILYPIWMLTPETVSDILPLVPELFDIVIFDEASQMFIEKAVPSLYRAKNVVIAGDDKQLRPSRFFESDLLTDEAEEILDDSVGKDISLLDQAKISFNSVNLMFHYRAKYAELIQFSNYAFYNSLLKLAPNIQRLNKTSEPTIVYKNVKGIKRDGINEKEAIEVANIVKEVLTTTNYTIGIISLNSKQRDCIEAKLDDLASSDNNFAALLARERNRIDNNEDTSIFVKSIEDVQGDERDVIIISVDRGYDASGKLYTALGPIAVDGGENRLNVAISRAKCREYIVTSLEPEDFNVENSKNSGPKLFKEFLKYARAVSNNNTDEVEAIVSAGTQSSKTVRFDSPFEEQVYAELKKLGWDIDTQVGVRGYRIDLAVYDSDLGRYIAGIECDGATYHSSKNARERDISRQRFLESRGWNILRIWSKNWWNNSKAEVDRINSELLKLKSNMSKIKSNTDNKLKLGDKESVSVNDANVCNKQEKYTGMAAVFYGDNTDDYMNNQSSEDKKKKLVIMKEALKESIKNSQLNNVAYPCSNDIMEGVTNKLNLLGATREDIKGKKIKGIIINDKNCVQLKSWHNVLTTVINETLKESTKEKIMIALGSKNFIELTPEGMSKPVNVVDNLWIESKLDAFTIIQRAKLICNINNKDTFLLLIGETSSKKN